MDDNRNQAPRRHTRSEMEQDACSLLCRHLAQPSELVVLDPDGDLHLVVGSNECLLPSYNTISGRRRLRLRREVDGDIKYYQERSKSPLSRGLRDLELDSENGEEIVDEETMITVATKKDANDLIQEQIQLTHDHHGTMTFVVCSKTLSRISKFFNKLLNGGFLESKRQGQNEQWTVHLPDDDPKSMEDILNIAHSRFDRLWNDPDLYRSGYGCNRFLTNRISRIYKTTVLSDKYDTVSLLRPYVQRWQDDVWEILQQTIEYDDNIDIISQALWISRHFGENYLFKQILMRMAFNTRLSEDGRPLYIHFLRWFHEQWLPLFQIFMEPPGAVGK